MRNVPALLLLASALAAPAAARIGVERPSNHAPRSQFVHGLPQRPVHTIGRDIRDMRKRIDLAVEVGAISKSEARQLKRDARVIARARRYDRDGLSDSERMELENRSRNLWSRIALPRL